MFAYFIKGCGIMEPVDILKMCFSNILYFKRKELNLSQGKMAEKCCMSLRQYADIESGKRFHNSTPSDKIYKHFINLSHKHICD